MLNFFPRVVYNHDQVPLQLASSASFSVDDTGADVVWDSITKSSDCKRFATLNLTIPMDVAADKSNLPKPHLIFSCKSGFKEGGEWAENERKEWSDAVHVSFQENAWADSETCVYALEALKEDVVSAMNGLNPVLFEDNLSSHKTNIVEEAWKSKLPGWRHHFFPPNLTWALQPVDRHIGKTYKTDVYKAIRSKIMEKIANGDHKPLTASEKRIIMTHSVAATHSKLAATGSYHRAFIATGTWLPIDGSKDAEVELQGLENYKYCALCSKTEVLEKKKEMEKEIEEKEKAAEDARIAREAREKEQKEQEERRRAQREAELEEPNRIGNAWLHANENRVVSYLRPIFETILRHVQGDFILAGSFLPFVISQFLRQSMHEFPILPCNDIDVFAGEFGPGSLIRTSHAKLEAPGIPKELNIIKAKNLNQTNLRETADINAIAINMLVRVPFMVRWDVSPEFWGFVFSKRLRTLNSRTPAQTLIRVAYKAFQMGVDFDSNLKPEGEFFASHMKKV